MTCITDINNNRYMQLLRLCYKFFSDKKLLFIPYLINTKEHIYKSITHFELFKLNDTSCRQSTLSTSAITLKLYNYSCVCGMTMVRL